MVDQNRDRDNNGRRYLSLLWAQPPLVTLVATVIDPAVNFRKKDTLSSPGMVCQGRQGVGVDLNSTGTELCTVGYARRTFL